MVRVTGSIRKSAAPIAASPIDDLMPTLSLQAIGMDEKSQIDRLVKAASHKPNLQLGNAERPSNLMMKTTGRTPHWYMYSLMDMYRREVSVLSTIILRTTTELFRYDLELRPKFALKCEECGHESQTTITHCPRCNSARLREPDETQKDYFKRPNGKSFIDEANNNGQSLKDVLKSYAESEIQNNQAYNLCITGDIIDSDTGRLIRSYPLEFLSIDPKYVRYLYDETGTPGTQYAFIMEDRKTLIDTLEDEDKTALYTKQGKELYPAAWQIGSNVGGTGEYWLYTEDEIYQDHWYRPSQIYGIPIWFDIEDDLLTYHYIEKHNLKKYKFGYVRKMIILPGFNDDDVEDITKGIQDILATNDNSIPIICTPPQMPGTAEMKAQTLELGTESSIDLMQIKDDIRDRLCAHGGVPNLFAGDVEASGGMNNESQQITVFDRYLMDKYNFIDRQCAWIMGWFPMITDWELAICRPSKAYTDAKRRMDKIQEAQMMKSLGFDITFKDGEFRYSEEPIDQIQRKEQEKQAQMNPMAGMMGAPMEGGMNDGGLVPGDGDGPPEQGTARREDGDIGESKDEIDLAKREADESFTV